MARNNAHQIPKQLQMTAVVLEKLQYNTERKQVRHLPQHTECVFSAQTLPNCFTITDTENFNKE